MAPWPASLPPRATNAATASSTPGSQGLPWSSSFTVNARRGSGRDRVVWVVGKVLYWLAVVAISLFLVVLLILFFESRDDSSLDESRRAPTSQST